MQPFLILHCTQRGGRGEQQREKAEREERSLEREEEWK